MPNFRLPLALGLAIFVTACGGGGGGGGSGTTSPTATTFPLRAAMDAITRDGETTTLTAIGTAATEATDGLCSGTLNTTSSPANVATSFQGQSALASANTSSITYTNCSPASNGPFNFTTYYDAQFTPRGELDSDGSYAVWLTPPTVPNTVSVGDSGVIGTLTRYTSTGTVKGRSDYSYAIEADTANTAVLNMIIRAYDASGQLERTSQTRRQLNSAGTAAPVLSSDIQFESPRLHLVFRR